MGTSRATKAAVQLIALDIVGHGGDKLFFSRINITDVHTTSLPVQDILFNFLSHLFSHKKKALFSPPLRLRATTSLYHFSPGTDHHLFHGNLNTGKGHGLFHKPGKARAAGHFHDQGGDAFNAGLLENLGKFFHI